jgi:hypothetical protein
MWADLLWGVAFVILLGAFGTLAWKWETARQENAALRDRVEKLTALGHICRPPTWTTRGPGGWIRPEVLSHWTCSCSTRYVLVRTYRPRPDGPFRLGWVTESEYRTGRTPSEARQDPETRLEHIPGVHRREGAI